MTSCSCETIINARDRFLRPAIVGLSQMFVGDAPTRDLYSEVTGTSNQTSLAGVVAIFLVGGVVNTRYDNTYHIGFGHIDSIPVGLETHIYVPVAQFLQQVANSYVLKLTLDAEEDSDLDSDISGSLC